MDSNSTNKYSYYTNNNQINNFSSQNTMNPPSHYGSNSSFSTSYPTTDYIKNLPNPHINENIYSNTSNRNILYQNINYQNNLSGFSNDTLKNVNVVNNNIYSSPNYGNTNHILTNFTNTDSIYTNKTNTNSTSTIQTNYVLSNSGNLGSNYTNTIYHNPANSSAINNSSNPISTGNFINQNYNTNNLTNNNNFDGCLKTASSANNPYEYNKTFNSNNSAPVNLISTAQANGNLKINSINPISNNHFSNVPNSTNNYYFSNVDFNITERITNTNASSENNKIENKLQNLNINTDYTATNFLPSSGNNFKIDTSTARYFNQNNLTNCNNTPMTSVNYQAPITPKIILTSNDHFEANKEKQNDIKVKKFSLNDFILLKTLGKGAFGRVRIGQNILTGNSIAIKSLKKSEIIKNKQGDHILNEIKILNLVDHPFSVKFNGFSQDSRFLYLGLELINGGELFTYLRMNTRLPLDQSRFYIAHIVLLLEYMHSKNIAYRDLKPENILIDKHGYLKLTDMGLAKIVENRTYTFCGTPEYMSPEIVSNKGYGKYVDWWATGILLYELLVGIDPFNDESGDPMKIFNNILTKNIAFPKDFDLDAKSLVKHLCDKDLSKRYGNLRNGALDVKDHRFFSNFSFDDLLNLRIRPTYIPPIKGENDTSQFMDCPDSLTLPNAVNPSEDVFAQWFV